MLAEKHSDEKLSTTLLIVETGIIAYHFEKIKDGKCINDILGGRNQYCLLSEPTTGLVKVMVVTLQTESKWHGFAQEKR